MQGYREVVSPPTVLSKKGVKFDLGEAAEVSFHSWKVSVTMAPILIHFDPQKAIIFEMDALDHVSTGVLLQHDDRGILHPVVFYSNTHSPGECNYEIYDKELLVVI